MPALFNEKNMTFTLAGGNVSYVIMVDESGKLMNIYWGKRVPEDSIRPCLKDYPNRSSMDSPEYLRPLELPTLCRGMYGTPVVDVVNGEGNHVTELKYVSHRIYKGKEKLAGLPATYAEDDSQADSLEIRLEDKVIGFQVTAKYSVFAETGAVTRSLLVENCSDKPVTLRNVQAASVPFWGNDFDVVHLKGSWARERAVVRTSLGEGKYTISSCRGASGHEENPFMALCEKNADENHGQVYAETLIYSGSFSAQAEVDNLGNTKMSIGLNPQVFTWLLEPGESFQSPEAVLVYSDGGFNGMSHVFHKLFRKNLARGYWRDRVRPVLVNNWEATYFDFNEEKLLGIAREAKEIGVELFVLDDGWFGKRNSDNCSLGDWTPNLTKLPDGLKGLSEKIHAIGLMFGIWVEPEMISPDSELYCNHPDWCLHVDGRERTQARHQLVLDMSRQDVQDYVIAAISKVLSDGNVDYVKWDMNRNMMEYFSEKLPAERKMETQHRYMLGLYRVLETITSSFPKVLFESCAAGGGRFDGGMLYYMPQTWTSDNTDAVARLGIQYGTSYVYPTISMGAHVSAVPNHQCHRSTPLSMRCNVAMCGNFGFEMDLGKFTEEEKEYAKAAVEQVKAVRSLTAKGEFSRLISPFEGQYAAWQFVSEGGNKGMLCVYRVLFGANLPPVRVRMVGLDENAVYLTDKYGEISGAEIMNKGIGISLQEDFSSEIIMLDMVK